MREPRLVGGLGCEERGAGGGEDLSRCPELQIDLLTLPGTVARGSELWCEVAVIWALVGLLLGARRTIADAVVGGLAAGLGLVVQQRMAALG